MIRGNNLAAGLPDMPEECLPGFKIEEANDLAETRTGALHAFCETSGHSSRRDRKHSNGQLNYGRIGINLQNKAAPGRRDQACPVPVEGYALINSGTPQENDCFNRGTGFVG